MGVVDALSWREVELTSENAIRFVGVCERRAEPSTKRRAMLVNRATTVDQSRTAHLLWIGSKFPSALSISMRGENSVSQAQILGGAAS